ncbi:PTS system mannose/fructose/sorbose family transporter subunit IIB [Listeria fleischmannii 1991]|jgi:fructoselysine and glucoselysine-specific PTS system IIB component|uniref:EIIAB-Man n=4 Tax=Listeria fleischmannii TaxID=1069827 RepID=A0A2X3GKP0_9LIST|nr:PTS system mannose/fructose/N-acetylgalactosamine-transporter subunit IIB [Listeria fleischmannii]EMG28784.1 PTS mannose-specific enzyme IIB component [Listeria fleischmannii subsp. fleischmannii LU2006-1]EUJ52935.1 PTS system mannose/fructose/sorbose family transporter subunit IIB [Listeria fleischmannii FSL S10-1203]KMT60141.1 PTS system mannose/fructose/sorbose family transporter subunit IIB [Listeria fleischmannii 1991]MBC1398016.1 PTS system mannose/fructose/N-acetylgalactosamine-transp
MIQFLRVDHRLLHGQVAVSWFNALDVNTILVASDSVAADDFRKSAIRLAKPEAAKLVMKSIEESIKAINSGVTDKYQMLIVVESVDDAYKLIDGTNGKIPMLNLGGTKQREGTTNFSKAVNLTDNEVHQLNDLKKRNIDIFIQQVPNEKKVPFEA